MNKINARGNKALCMAIAMIIALALLPVAAAAAGDILDITPGDSTSITHQNTIRFSVTDNVIIVSEDHFILI